MKAISIIRGRGQLTIPGSIRKVVNWATPMSAVSISVTKSDQIVITPHKKQYDWDKIWEGIERARAIKGKGKATSSSEFLERDRRSH